MRLGVGKSDDTPGHEIDVHTGDVLVVPAGTAHSCAESTEDYRYIGVYPTVNQSPIRRSHIECWWRCDADSSSLRSKHHVGATNTGRNR